MHLLVFATLLVPPCLARIGMYLSASSVQLTDETIAQVQARLIENSNRSWEIGTMQTALLELNAPKAFLYTGSLPPVLASTDDATAVFASVNSVLAQKPPGILPFFQDGAIGDPASVGIPFLIRHATQSLPVTNWSTAADQQLNYLVNVAPRTPDQAISQRAPPEPVQLWADFMCMAPPFIAYYGAIHNQQYLIELAFNQLRLYRAYLIDGSQMLQHIVLGNDGVFDYNHWATGNGWALMGMLRVLRVIELSPFASQMYDEQGKLISWASALTTAIWKHQQPDGSLFNYMDLPRSSTFVDASGTALIAAATFRLATIMRFNQNHYLNMAAADKARQYIVNNVGSDGWLNNVVDPYDWHQAGSHSPEGQAFVLMLQSAYRDWRAATGGYY